MESLTVDSDGQRRLNVGVAAERSRNGMDSYRDAGARSEANDLSARDQPAKYSNDVDTWIDELDDNRSCSTASLNLDGIGANVLMASLVQQYLPQIDIPKFGGEPLHWVEFIVAFRDVVHNQPYLNDKQRHHHLNQHLVGEAKLSVQEYTNDARGYVASLKKIKYLFGQRATVARAILNRVTKGKIVANNDVKALSRFYYDVCSCLITLKQLNYAADLYSADTLAQAVKRLPHSLSIKWAEKSLYIRERNEEPSLVHIGTWLKQRVLVTKEMGYREEPKRKEDVSLINTMVSNT